MQEIGRINESKALFWLSLSSMTAKRLNTILREFSALELWDIMGSNPTRLEPIFGKSYENLKKYKSLDFIEGGIDKINKMGVEILPINSPNYPFYLNQPEVSPPIVLFYMGNLKVVLKPCVAIVGTRSSSSYGADVAQMVSRELVLSGVTVVSGLASGIDEHAHKSAIATARASTAAVLGGGFNHITAYSRALFDKILSTDGLVLSEYRPNTTPTKYSFPERNRIISGLSRAVVVVEAPLKSGALITADYALEQNREVFAVPNGILSEKSSGCNNLIKTNAAQILTSTNDILTNLKLNSPQLSKNELSISLDIFEEKIYNLLLGGQLHFNQLIDGCAQDAKAVIFTLTNMELKGIVKRLAGNFYRLSLNKYIGELN